MRVIWAVFALLIFSTVISAQRAGLEQLMSEQRSLERAIAEQGERGAFLRHLTTDAIVFQPLPLNGREFWTAQPAQPDVSAFRRAIYADLSSNGVLGFVTGTWRSYPNGKSETHARNGQFVTIWEKRQGGRFQATLDIRTTHDKAAVENDGRVEFGKAGSSNKRGFSPADGSMDFLRKSMSGRGLGDAYRRYAADGIRLLSDGEPPITGKDDVVARAENYFSVAFPTKVVLFQAADMAYTWNPCEFDTSNEGRALGNCLQIWKLRGKEWYIVLSVFSRVRVTEPPELKSVKRTK